tara:strand:+ start:7519 stop:7920 length:402 start_codon:yes stop_codon:yes gene_type:complete
MGALNKVQLIGNLGRDPEVRTTASGTTVANFTMATTEKWSGEERTEWHRIVAFAKLADLCRDYLKKGQQVYLEGRIQTREWDDRDGNKRQTTEIIVRELVFLGKPSNARQQTMEYDKPNKPADDPFGGDNVPF